MENQRKDLPEHPLSDMEHAIALSEHITTPCGDGENTLQEYWLKFAKEYILNYTNPYAKAYLQGFIDRYSKNP